MRTLEWVGRYEAAWRTPGTEALREVFAPRARYRQSPYHEPFIGLDAIGAMWERERASPDEAFTLTASVVAAKQSGTTRETCFRSRASTQAYSSNSGISPAM